MALVKGGEIKRIDETKMLQVSVGPARVKKIPFLMSIRTWVRLHL